MHEVSGEPRPLVHFQQEVGDLDAREQRGGLSRQGIGLGRHGVGQRRYLQDAVGQRGVGQFAALGKAIDRNERLMELAPRRSR